MRAPIDAVDQTLAAIARYQRSDLEGRLRQARARLTGERIRVLVVGEFKQGKSMLVNGLVRAPVCPAYADLATSVPTVVHHAETPSAALIRMPERDADTPGPARDERPSERVEVPIDELAAHIAEVGNPDNEQRWHHVDIGIPRGLLIGGLELVDTPGVGGLSSVHGAATMAALATADAVLMVSDASGEYTAPELEFLRKAAGVCPNVACVLTKIDLYAQWRRVRDLDRAHLDAAGIDAQLLAVSSTMRIHAIRSEDEVVNEESGFPALVDYLRHQVVGKSDLLAMRSTTNDITAVTDQLTIKLKAELAAHTDPDAAAEVIAELNQARARSAALKERSARWQHTLGDGITDLNADIEYDLRDRMREIVRAAEDAINEGDPQKTWEQIAAWVEQETSNACASNYLWATQRARWLAAEVAEHFAGEGEQLLPELRFNSDDGMNLVPDMQLRDVESFGLGQKTLAGMRGGYVGVLMFGMLGTFAGMPLINPFSIGAGLLLGGKGLADERRRVVTKRQNEAKSTVRRYSDDVIFQVSKQSRDMLRSVQRDMRDHYTGIAEEINQSVQDSLRAAEKAAKLSESERQRRRREIPSELEKLDGLRRKATLMLEAREPANQLEAAR